MACNCKAKKDSEKIIKTIEEIDKSSRKDYVRGSKTLRKIAFDAISIFVYISYFILLTILIGPLIIYMACSKKPLTIKPFKLLNNGKQ